MSTDARSGVHVGGTDTRREVLDADKQTVDAPETPLVEYPKMLYIGPYRQQVTVNTAKEEAEWLAAHDEQMQPASGATKASASVPGVQVLGAPVSEPEPDLDDDEDTTRGHASKKR